MRSESSSVSGTTPAELDEPLPQTMRFVIVLGVAILIGWFAMFALLQSRW